MVGCRNENILYEVTFLGGHAQNALSATVLLVVGIQLHALDVVVVADGNHHILIGNQIFLIHLGHIVGNGSAAFITELCLYLGKLLLDDSHNLAFISQHGFQPFNLFQNFLIFFLNLLTLQTGQPLQTQIKNCLSLLLRQLEAIHQGSTGNIRSL